jgi:GH24 family phage-related lysozyme (muramidase)
MKIIYFLPLLILETSALSIGSRGLALIKKYESFKAKTYYCPAGKLTIGYGTTTDDESVIGTKIKPGMTISEKQASLWLQISLNKKYAPKVNKYNGKYHWTQNEFDALVSFAYNIGSIDELCAHGKRSKSQIADAMLEYRRGGGRVLPGLVNRRREERQLFLSGGSSAINKEFGKNSLNQFAKEVINDEWDRI